jgi:hypothetical protein
MQQMNFRSCPGQPSGKRLRRSLGGMITMTRAPALRLLMLTAGGALLALTVARLLLLAIAGSWCSWASC